MENIPHELIAEAKRRYGLKAVDDIRAHFSLENFDETALKASCPFHEDRTPSFIWNAKDDGQSFHCFSCGRNFGIIDLKIATGMTFLDAVEWLFLETGISYRIQDRGLKPHGKYRYPKYVAVHNERKTVEGYWKLRCISPATLDLCNVSEDADGNTVFHLFDQHGTLMTVKYRPSRAVKKGQTKFWTNDKDEDKAPVLYGMEVVDPTQPLLITEGEPDRLAAVESGFTNAVSVPFGAGGLEWIQYNFEWLEQFKEIIVWSDNDDAGVKMRRESCSRLGVWRTRFVDLPNIMKLPDGNDIQIKDINEVLFYFGKDKVLEFIRNAKEVPVENVANLAEQPDFDIERADGLYTPFADLNHRILKFVLGNVIVVTGRPGAGKSTLVNQMFVAEALNQGLDVFAYSGEMATPIFRRWLETTMIGRENIKLKRSTAVVGGETIEINQKHVKVLDAEEREKMRQWYNMRVMVYDNPLDNTADSILLAAEGVVRKFGAKVIILDNLMKIDIGATGDKDIFQRQKDFIVRLCSFAQAFNVLIVLVAHPRKTAEIRRLVAEDVAGSADIGNLAHYIIGVHRYTRKEKEGIKTAGGGQYKKGFEPIEHDNVLEVFKNRITGDANFEVQLYFDGVSLRFYTQPKELWKRYVWDVRTTPLPVHDPNKHELIPQAMGGGGGSD